MKALAHDIEEGSRIDKTRSSRIVLVHRRPIFVDCARIATPLWCLLALTLFSAGCARRSSAKVPSPPKPAKIGATETGIASWYGVPYDGRPSASGEIFDMRSMTAAHRNLPFQTWLEVTNLTNGKRVDVRINDRGPFVRGRIIDLSMSAATELDMLSAGTARVRLKVIPPPAIALESSSGPESTYAVQAAAFSDGSRAEAFRETLPWADTRVVERGGGEGRRRLWRVLVGHALSFEAARSLASEVQKATGEAMVVKE